MPGIPLSCSKTILRTVWSFSHFQNVGFVKFLLEARRHSQGRHPPGGQQRSDGRVGSAPGLQEGDQFRGGVYALLVTISAFCQYRVSFSLGRVQRLLFNLMFNLLRNVDHASLRRFTPLAIESCRYGPSYYRHSKGRKILCPNRVAYHESDICFGCKGGL